VTSGVLALADESRQPGATGESPRKSRDLSRCHLALSCFRKQEIIGVPPSRMAHHQVAGVRGRQPPSAVRQIHRVTILSYHSE
jgi:hypothetical protein